MNALKQVSIHGVTMRKRTYHQAIVFRDRLFVLMGTDGDTGEYLGDIRWTQNTQKWYGRDNLTYSGGNKSWQYDGQSGNIVVHSDSMIIPARRDFGICEHAGKVYLMGGFMGSSRLNDVYVTNDMFHWNRLPDAPWTQRAGHAIVSLNGRLWFMGGSDWSLSHRNDVWSTLDGVNWREETNLFNLWQGRALFGHTVYNNRFYVVGGMATNGTSLNDVWYTTDFKTWTRMDSNANFPARYDSPLVTFEKAGRTRLVMLGGYLYQDKYGQDYYSNEFWHSGNGDNWIGGNSIPINGGISSHVMKYFNKHLIIYGGINDNEVFDTVWSVNLEMFGA
jgi:hypothetical protein